MDKVNKLIELKEELSECVGLTEGDCEYRQSLKSEICKLEKEIYNW